MLMLLALLAVGDDPEPMTLPYPDAADAQPFPGAPDVVAGIVVSDLHTLFAAERRRRDTLEKTRVGQAYAASEKEAGGPLSAHLMRFADAVQPEGPQAFQALVFSQGYAVQAQFALKAAPGALERLKATSAAPWTIESTPDGDVLRMGDVRLAMHLDDQGYLRLALTPAWAKLPLAAPALEGDVKKWMDDCYAVLFADGHKPLLRDLLAAFASPDVNHVLSELRTLAIGLRDDSGKSTQLRIVLDAPPLLHLGPLLRGPQGVATTAPAWPGDVLTTASVAVPPPVLGGVLAEMERQLANTPHALPRPLLDALARFTGRVELVSFAAPDDWALSLSFADDAAAKSVVPVLEPYITQILQATSPTSIPLVHRETAEVLLVRPDAALEGPRLFALGKHLVLCRQRARADALRAAMVSAPPVMHVDGPLTDLVRSTAERSGVLNLYSVLGDDAAWADYFAWALAGAQGALDKVAAESPQLGEILASPMLKPLTHRMALTAALGGVASLLTYDVAAYADVEGSVFVVELSTSEI